MRVCLGIPSVGGVPGAVYASHLALAGSMGRRCELVVPGVFDVKPHSRAREEVVLQAVRAECDYLMFVDSDMEVPPDAFTKLLEALLVSKAQMTVGHFYRRGYPFTPTWYKQHEGKIYQVTTSAEGELAELDSCGMACNLIDLRWCREHLSEPWFFQGKVEGLAQEYVWEDSYFCWKMKEKGGRIIGVPSIRVGHLGPAIVVNDNTQQMLNQMWLKEHPETTL